jgi:ficolin
LYLLSTYEGESAWAQYERFHVAGPEDGYRLTVSGYSGTAGDSLTHHTNMRFSTHDMDQDLCEEYSCASGHSSGWWYNCCFHANPNGQMPPTSPVCASMMGLNWVDYKGFEYSLKTMLLKIRRL